jgi:8-oxo-dGTP pyrophosphatase MutT (NUDIX family)
MHKDELWQTYAPNGEPILGEGWDSALDNPEKTGSDAIVGVAVVLLYRRNTDGGLEFLWQKRSDKIDRHAGYYDLSAGGHINLGETITEAAIREAREEIGVKITPEDLQFAFTKPFNKNRFAWIFCVDYTGRDENFHFNDEEVSEVRWVGFAEMDKFRKNFAKPPLAKDDITFMNLRDWLEMHEDL